MRILIVKLSSMGDVIHALPVLSDIKQALGNVTLDWLVEPAFAPLIGNHPLIHQVLTVPLRMHKGQLASFYRSDAAKALRQHLKAQPYDAVLDLQGLVKSAWLSRWAKGTRHGYDRKSAREPLASMGYQKKYTVSPDLHAITRMRQLASQALGYDCPTSAPDYGFAAQPEPAAQTIMLIPNTTWASKHWPEAHWHTLAKALSDQGIRVLISWYSMEDYEQAHRICAAANYAKPAPPCSIADMQKLLATCSGFVACDTGFAHLATALNIPGIILMGPTDGKHTGPMGDRQVAMSIDLPCRPCRKRECPLSYQPDELRPACMAGIIPQAVATRLLGLLGK